MDEPDTVRSVVCSGLLPAYQPTVDSALEVAMSVLVDRLRSFDFRTRQNSARDKSRYGSSATHVAMISTTAPAELQKQVCSSCHKPGHHSRECRGNLLCTACGMKGHSQQSCRRVPSGGEFGRTLRNSQRQDRANRVPPAHSSKFTGGYQGPRREARNFGPENKNTDAEPPVSIRSVRSNVNRFPMMHAGAQRPQDVRSIPNQVAHVSQTDLRPVGNSGRGVETAYGLASVLVYDKNSNRIVHND